MKNRLVVKIKMYKCNLSIGQLHNLVMEWCETTSLRYNQKGLLSVASGYFSETDKYIEIEAKHINLSDKTYLMNDIYNYVSYLVQTLLLSNNIKFDLEWKWKE